MELCDRTETNQQKIYEFLPADEEDGLSKENQVDVKKTESIFCRWVKPIRGYLFGLLFAFSMCMANLLVKMGPSLDAPNHSAIRYAIQLVIMYAIIRYNKFEPLGPKSQRKLLIFRGIVGCGAVIFGFFSVKYLDISDVETLTNSAVIITAILSRIFLDEKLTMVHFFSLILTIAGVLFVVRPNFLFGLEYKMENLLKVNLSSNHSVKIHNIEIKDHSNRDFNETLIGVVMVMINAVCLSIVQVVIRKLCLVKVHFSVTSIYPAMVGFVTSMVLSGAMVGSGLSVHKEIESSLSDMLIEIGYSLTGGLLGTIGIVFMYYALKYEDATKIGMVKRNSEKIYNVLKSFSFGTSKLA
ncbi:solute carrier family 35 member G1 [Brachionus plicatilis]|uniref:Solute carrier family 35 member G1 n=1 Tax=Brachionus plicatilis TaxID=10195 RepID=A0A3M7RM33_BRAPC|nr:solute carrier family 35 member G1 [Brachionus plicatilis]